MEKRVDRKEKQLCVTAPCPHLLLVLNHYQPPLPPLTTTLKPLPT
jgi:hypothetical protein